MRTKWVVVGLFLLGLVSAVAAAFMVATLRLGGAGGHAGANTPVQIVVATKTLPPLSVVDSGSVTTRTVTRAEAPPRALSGAAQVVGKVLAVPVGPDQAFTDGCFATEGSGRQMAATLANGMRAVSVSLSDHCGLEGVLYPGCVVDVLASVKLPDRDGVKDEMVSVPLLQRVQVLTVNDQTVFSPDDKPPTVTRTRGGRMLVTLMVDPDQARILQLTGERGALSLAMRNPFDRDPINATPMLFSNLLGIAPRAETRSVEPGASAPGGSQPPPAPASIRLMEPARWQVTVFRAGALTKQTFDWPDTASEAPVSPAAGADAPGADAPAPRPQVP